MNKFNKPNATLAEASTWVQDNAANGVICPCCSQHAKLYRRPFNSGMAVSLLWLVRYYEEVSKGSWIDVPRTAPKKVLRSREFDKLKLWGVAETRESDDPTKRTSGLWRPTDLGIAVVRSDATVSKYLSIYNGNIVDRSKAQATLKECLNRKFDFEELMHVADLKAAFKNL